MLRRLWRKFTNAAGIKTMSAIATVAVYVTKDTIFVISQQMTDHGRVSVDPMLRLEANAAPGAAGAAVLQCLDAFQDIDGLPESGHLERLLGFVGARSWSAFAKHAINISVEGPSKDRVALAAARADGRGAYAHGPSRECRREPLAIGELLLELVSEQSSAGP
jgi:hypothetical protein